MTESSHRVFRIGHWVAGSPALGFVCVATVDNSKGILSEETLDRLIPRLVAVLEPNYGSERKLVLHPEDLAEPEDAEFHPSVASSAGSGRTMAWLYSHLIQDKGHDHAIYCTQIILAYIAGEPDAEAYVLAARQRFSEMSFAYALAQLADDSFVLHQEFQVPNNFVRSAVAMAMVLAKALLERALNDYSDAGDDPNTVAARLDYQYLAAQSQL